VLPRFHLRPINPVV